LQYEMGEDPPVGNGTTMSEVVRQALRDYLRAA
jgi:hypothetical protein